MMKRLDGVGVKGAALVLAFSTAAGVASAQSNPDLTPCVGADIDGQALGLCQAFYAVDCLGDGNEVACERILRQYEDLGVGPMPGVVTCPCFSRAEVDALFMGVTPLRCNDDEPYLDAIDTRIAGPSQVAATWDLVDYPWYVCDFSGPGVEDRVQQVSALEHQACIAAIRGTEAWTTCP